MTVYEPGLSSVRGSTVTALSAARISDASPVVLPAKSAQVGNGPLGPVMVAEATLVTFSGIIEMTGRPAVPLQPQKVSGFGDSVTNLERLVVVPLPGKLIGHDGRPMLLCQVRRARSASRPSATSGCC